MKWNLIAKQPSVFTPDTAFALLSSIRGTGNPAGIESRKSDWNSVTPDFLRRYSSDYLPWVEKLPVGPDREEAAAAVLNYMKKDDLPGYRRIRALVTDPVKLATFPPR